MPPRRNPLQMSHLLGQIRRTVDGAKDRAHDWAEHHGVETKYVDVAIHFIGAAGIPKMDVVGTADPYFIAKLDADIKYVCVLISPCSRALGNAGGGQSGLSRGVFKRRSERL